MFIHEETANRWKKKLFGFLLRDVAESINVEGLESYKQK